MQFRLKSISILSSLKLRSRYLISIALELFIEMTPEEEIVVKILNEEAETGIDELTIKSGLSMSRCSAALLNLEFEGVVKSLPGKMYSIC